MPVPSSAGYEAISSVSRFAPPKKSWPIVPISSHPPWFISRMTGRRAARGKRQRAAASRSAGYNTFCDNFAESRPFEAESFLSAPSGNIIIGVLYQPFAACSMNKSHQSSRRNNDGAQPVTDATPAYQSSLATSVVMYFGDRADCLTSAAKPHSPSKLSPD